MGLDALTGDAAALDQPRLDVRLHVEGALAVLRRAGQPFQHRLPPGHVRLAHRRQLPQEPYRRGVGQLIGGVGVVDVAADEMGLQHPVDGDEALHRVRKEPDVFAEAGEVVGGRFLAGARRPQLLQPLAEQIGGLGVVEDVVAEGRLEGELRRGVGPAADHLHELDFEVAVVGQALRVLLDREAPAELAAVYDGHGRPPSGVRVTGDALPDTLSPVTLHPRVSTAPPSIAPLRVPRQAGRWPPDRRRAG